jgi:hypothetical protein
MVVARSGALTAVRGRLAPVLGRTETARRQSLRAAVSAAEAAAKRGRQRRDRVVRTGGGPRWRWLLAPWQGTQVARARARDATTRGDRCGVVVVSRRDRGGALPVRWGGLPAGQPGA